MKFTHLLAIALVSIGTGGTAAALTLTIEVAGARSAQGSVNAALYTGSPTMGALSFGEAVIDVRADTTLQLTLR